jgi:hypothetical protein
MTNEALLLCTTAHAQAQDTPWTAETRQLDDAATHCLGRALSQLTRLVSLELGGVAVVPPGISALVRLRTLR